MYSQSISKRLRCHYKNFGGDDGGDGDGCYDDDDDDYDNDKDDDYDGDADDDGWSPMWMIIALTSTEV